MIPSELIQKQNKEYSTNQNNKSIPMLRRGRSKAMNRKKQNPERYDKNMLNKWQSMINEQTSLGAQCDYYIKDAKQTLLQERQMRQGFMMARTKVLKEKAPVEGEDPFDTNDDAGMQPAVGIKGEHYGNKKI